VNIIKPGQTVYIIRRFPSWVIDANVVKQVSTGDGRQYEAKDGNDCYIGIKQAIEWHKHDEVYVTENDAKLALAKKLRDEAQHRIEWAARLVAEATPPKPIEVGIPQPTEVELHLGTSSDFSRYSKRVKALGGRYSDCRGNASKRYVTLPWSDEGRALANKLFEEFVWCQKTTLIVRGVDSYRNKHVHAWVIVHKIDKGETDACTALLKRYEAAFEQAFPDCLASV
jgi:hypothetical protein